MLPILPLCILPLSFPSFCFLSPSFPSLDLTLLPCLLISFPTSQFTLTHFPFLIFTSFVFLSDLHPFFPKFLPPYYLPSFSFLIYLTISSQSCIFFIWLYLSFPSFMAPNLVSFRMSFPTSCYTSSLPPLLSYNTSFFSLIYLNILSFPLFLSLSPAFSPGAKHKQGELPFITEVFVKFPKVDVTFLKESLFLSALS